MNSLLWEKAFLWTKSAIPFQLEKEYYCETRDIFQARLDTMVAVLSTHSQFPESAVYLVSAIAGEIGNNSFDHNIGNWPDMIGIFFSYELRENILNIILADRGQGVLQTLKRVKPELKDDEEALAIAFTEKISGRAPEPRGNGLKFVKESIKEGKKHLVFISKSAKVELNETMEVTPTEKINGCLALITHSNLP